MAESNALFSFASMAATYGVIYGVFAWTDDRLRDEARQSVTAWIDARAEPSSYRTIVGTLYDLVFGESWFSTRLIFVVCILSLGCYVVALSTHVSHFPMPNLTFLPVVTRLVFLCFLSVMVGRIQVSLLARYFGLRTLPLYIVIDLAVKLLVGYLIDRVIQDVFFKIDSDARPLESLGEIIVAIDIGTAYVLFCLIFSFSLIALYIVFLLRSVMDFEKKPIKSVGSVCALMCALAYPCVVWLYRLGTFPDPSQ